MLQLIPRCWKQSKSVFCYFKTTGINSAVKTTDYWLTRCVFNCTNQCILVNWMTAFLSSLFWMWKWLWFTFIWYGWIGDREMNDCTGYWCCVIEINQKTINLSSHYFKLRFCLVMSCYCCYNILEEVRAGKRHPQGIFVRKSPGHRFAPLHQIGHVNIQSCLLINFLYKSISLQNSGLSFEQPIRIDWVLYKYHLEFPTNKKIIPLLTCPITITCLHMLFKTSF